MRSIATATHSLLFIGSEPISINLQIWSRRRRFVQTLKQQLDSVQRAIAAIEGGGQEVDIEVNQNRRRVTRADLRELYRREAQLKTAIARQNGEGVFYVIPR
jgi:hypothetical protein